MNFLAEHYLALDQVAEKILVRCVGDKEGRYAHLPLAGLITGGACTCYLFAFRPPSAEQSRGQRTLGVQGEFKVQKITR